MKRILTAGTGGKPESGWEVTAHYVGTLQSNGSEFDSSRARDKPFSFRLGEGKVIKGWEEGIASMQKGEKAMFMLQPEYAYGAQGAPPKIPPNAVLEFEIELLACHPVGFEFQGVLYDRAFDPYAEEPHPAKDELWMATTLARVLGAIYPKDEEPMEYEVFLPSAELAADAKVARLIGCDRGGDKDVDTWKEILVYKEWDVVHVFNLLSHGRRMYRSLIFTSKSQYALHCLPPLLRDKPLPLVIKNAAGDLKERRVHEGQLLVSRRNTLLGGQEVFVPARLLQGVLPSSVLEAYRFWQGDDHMLRGEPVDSSSQWFNYNIEVLLSDEQGQSAIVSRRPPGKQFRRISDKQMDTQSALVRQRSKINATPNATEDEAVAQLMGFGFSAAASALALRACSNDVNAATNWLLDEANAEAIKAEDDAAEAEELEEAAALQRSSSSSEPLAVLVERGFSSAVAAYALSIHSNDVALAQHWLSEPKNEEEIAQLESNEDRVEDKAGAVAAEEAEGTADDMVLLNLLEAAETDPVLHRVATVMARLEDLSHVLAWTTTDVKTDGVDATQCRLEVLELPRLKIRFQLVT